jgi:hypothetical protein
MYYKEPLLFGSQDSVDSIIDEIVLLLEVPRWHLHVVCALALFYFDFNSSLIFQYSWEKIQFDLGQIAAKVFFWCFQYIKDS